MLRIGSMFSGIGGLELGLERSGLGRVVWQVEAHPFARRVLARHWPDVDRSVEDVRHASKENLAPVNVICGGFPCQDVSAAGRGEGLEGERSGLWFEFARVVDDIRPCAVVVENVRSGAKRWVPTICEQLSAMGYRVRPLGIAARDVGAPQNRARVFVVAAANTHGSRWRGAWCGCGEPRTEDRARARGHAGRGDHGRGTSTEINVADADRECIRLERGRQRWACGRGPSVTIDACRRAAESGVDRGAHGLPAGLDGAWPAGRGPTQHAWEPTRTVAPRTVRHRGARVRALGNAVVPACALVAGLVLQDMMEGRA